MGFEDRFANRFHTDIPAPLPVSSLKRKQSFSDKFWKKTLRSSFRLPRYGTLRARSKSKLSIPESSESVPPKREDVTEEEKNPINLNENIKGCLPMSSSFSVISLGSTLNGKSEKRDLSTFHLRTEGQSRSLSKVSSWRNSNMDVAVKPPAIQSPNFYGSSESHLARTDFSCRVTPKSAHSSSCTDLNKIYRIGNPLKTHVKRSSLVITSSSNEKNRIKPPIAEKPKLNKMVLTPPKLTAPPKRFSPETQDINNNTVNPLKKSSRKELKSSLPYEPMKHSPPPPPIRAFQNKKDQSPLVGQKYHSEVNLSDIGQSINKEFLGGSVMNLNKFSSPTGSNTLSRQIFPACGHGINIAEISKIKLRPVVRLMELA